MKSKLPDLPQSEDKYWEGAETYRFNPIPVNICSTHGKTNWQEHTSYLDNHDGTVSCKFCSFGAKIPGYMKVIEGRIVDLRNLSKR